MTTPDTPAHTPLPWAIKHVWGFEAVQIVRVSKSRAYYIHQWAGRGQERFCDAGRILPWRGDEAGAQKLVEKLNINAVVLLRINGLMRGSRNSPHSRRQEAQVSETCSTCRWWGTMGKCNKQSGMRMMGGISWHQLVTTKPKETCPSHQPKEGGYG